MKYLALALALAACGDGDDNDPTKDWVANTGAPAHVNGMAFVFGPNGGGLVLEGATVSVTEDPTVSTSVQADGSFAFDVPSGGPVTFTIAKEGFQTTQSAAIDVESDGIPMLGFQIPTLDTVGILATLIRITVDPARCQVVTTVSRAGTEPYGGTGLGVEGAIVTLDPPKDADGPIYFMYDPTLPTPSRDLTMTSLDGGIVYANVAVGEYTMAATKAGVNMSDIDIRCRAGVLVNAAPPHGIQEI
ncbi:MAG TPA: carboxypeptidase-like regulatory domain-containing protein [Kofleriaceae bacterium]